MSLENISPMRDADFSELSKKVERKSARISNFEIHRHLATVRFWAVRPRTVARSNGSEALWRKNIKQHKIVFTCIINTYL